MALTAGGKKLTRKSEGYKVGIPGVVVKGVPLSEGVWFSQVLFWGFDGLGFLGLGLLSRVGSRFRSRVML